MTLLRMKLNAADILFCDDRGKIVAVAGSGDAVGLITALDMIGMNEIKSHVFRHISKQRVGFGDI